jgi:uncharacterized repeat protein (TIGR01451 family)
MTLRLSFFIVAAHVAQAGFAQLFGGEQIISDEASSPGIGYSADMDSDGDMDLLVPIIDYSWGPHFAWYENLGGGQFATAQNVSDLVPDPYMVHAADFDSDGDMDVLSTSQGIVDWYENLDDEDYFGPQQIVNTWVFPQAVFTSIFSADLDQDGDMDVLSSDAQRDEIAWYENINDGLFATQQVIYPDADNARSVHAADLDGDGDMDVLSASKNDDMIAWYENLGGAQFGTLQIISVQADGAREVFAADLDLDGDIDVLSASENDDKIAWYQNNGAGQFGAEQIIPTEPGSPYSVSASDFDLDGDMDVLSASSGSKIVLYENLGNGSFVTLQMIQIDGGYPMSVHTSDVDGDGDLDLCSSIWGANNIDRIVWYENEIGSGCTDDIACNFNPDVSIDDGSCCYTNCGCTDPLATNYSETATCENGTCEYVIAGTVFFDENENGIIDGSEYGLPFQTVVLEESGQTFTTNNEGNFIADIGSSQSAVFTLQGNPDFTFNTTPNPAEFNAETAESTQLLFGVSNEFADFEVEINFYPSGDFFLCNDYFNYDVFFRNMGNVPIDGIIEIEYDQLFQGYQEVTPIDSVIGNTIYMSYQNLLPGQMFHYNIDLLTPTVDHIGEYVTSYARVYGYYDGEEVAFGEEELTMEIACAYDPNDKQAFPLGYTDDHLLLQQTEQEFVIRFQNTGNAPAQNIRIQDTLDVNFDIASFRLIANSHSVMTTVDPETRLVDFYFENIQLPDSVNNEPESHGVISYVVTPNPSLPVGTVLENTAYIYFDNNDPIITNTTWTTIHECGGEAAFEPDAVLVCNEPQVNFESSYDLVEHYSWLLDGEEAGANAELFLSLLINPEYVVTLTASNPLCTETNTLNYVVPDIASIDPCIADLNCDGFRSTQDLLVMISDFGCVSNCQADIDDNGMVNVIDLFIFASLFELSCWD